MAIRNLSRNEKILLSICIVLGTVAVTYNLFIEPVVFRWKALNDGIESKTSVLIKNTRLLQIYKALQEEYEKYQGAIDTTRNEEEEFARSLGEIENISKKSSCRVENIKPHTPKKVGKYKEISFEVSAEGTIGQISRFLYEIETSKQNLRIRRFTLTSKSGVQTNLRGTFLISRIIVY